MNIRESLKKLLQPAVIRNATDYERVDLLFGNGNILFDVDAESGLDQSSFYGFLGRTGDPFNLSSLGCYLRIYGLPHGYDLEDIAEEYALYTEELLEREGGVAPEHHALVQAWFKCSPTDKKFSKSPYFSCFMDFGAYFLLDVLKLEYRILE